MNYKFKNKNINLKLSKKVFKPNLTTECLIQAISEKKIQKKIKNFRFRLWNWYCWNFY